MSAADPSSDADPLVGLAEEFAERYRRGERPALTEYTDRYPDQADRIRKLFPAMVVMEEFGSVAGPDADTPGGSGGGAAPPRQLGEYRILREVGRGGMGVVYEAVQESLGRHVALKVLPAQRWKTSTHLERFRREARAVARLHHTNIVPVFGVGECDGVHYYAMQFIQGQSLDNVLHELRRLRRARSARPGGPADAPPAGDARRPALSASIAEGLVTGRFPEGDPIATGSFAAGGSDGAGGPTPPFASWGGEAARGGSGGGRSAPSDGGARSELTAGSDAEYVRGVARVGVQAAEALAYAHAQGILHRDVKPGNLLLDTQGTVWVTDFGLAKADDGGELTGEGDIIGTLRYMAPERFRGEADPRSDVYGLGLTLYELLTLRPAFEDSDRPRLMERIARKDPPAPRTLDPQIPRDLETVVLKAVAKEPAHRYPTAAALAEDLRRFLADRPILARRTSWAEHGWRWCRRNPSLAGLLAAVAALLVVTVVVLAVSNARIRGALEQQELALYYQWIAAAADARDRNRAALAEELLDRCPPRLRGWEWHYLKRLPFATLPPLDHGGKVILRMAHSADGELLAVGCRDGLVSVWDSRTGKPVLKPFQAQKELIRGVAFSPDRRYLVTGGQDDRLKLWDPRTGVLVREFPIEREEVLLALTFSPDGRWLAASYQDRTIRVWEVEAGAQVARFGDDQLAIAGLEFTADGRQLLAVTTEGVVKAWDVAAGTATTLFDAGLQAVDCAAFSPDRRLLALGAEDGTAKVLRTDPWALAWPLEVHTSAVRNLAFGAGGERLAVCAGDGMIRVWDMRTGQEALSVDFAGIRSNALAFSPDGHRLALGSHLSAVQVLDGTPLGGSGDGGQARTLEGHRHLVTGLAYSPDGGRVASVSWDRTARVWDARTGRELRMLPAGGAPLTGVAISRDGGRVAAASPDGTVRAWDVDNGTELFPTLRPQAGPVYGVAFSRDGQALASAHHDGRVRIWDAATGQPRATINAHKHPVLGLAFSPDGKRLVTAGGKGHKVKVWEWEADTRNPVYELEGPDGIIRNPAFSPDGNRVVALIGAYREVWLWDVTPGGAKTPPGKKLGLEGIEKINQVVFHPDGRRLAVVSDDRVQLLDPDTGRGPSLIGRHAGTIGCVAFSPDGRWLATGAGYRNWGEVRIWDVARWEKKP